MKVLQNYPSLEILRFHKERKRGTMWVISLCLTSEEENELHLIFYYDEMTENNLNLANLGIFNPSETQSSYSLRQNN